MLELKKYANCLVLANKEIRVPTLKKIPAAVYSINVAEDGDIVLTERVKKYTLPEKIYGVSHKRNLAIMGRMYEERTEKGLNTGAMLTGFKGCGKSLLAENVANEMIARERPVFVIDKAFNIDILTKLAKYAGQCMFYFDEFEKTYSIKSNDGDDVSIQDKLLTFFSSTEFGGVLSVLVSNSGLNGYLINRPQRMLLRFSYGQHTRNEDFASAMDELGMTQYMKAALLLGSSDDERNIDSLLTVADVIKNHYSPDDPTTGDDVMEIIRAMNVDVRWPRQGGIEVVEIKDPAMVGCKIETKLVVKDHRVVTAVTVTNVDGIVVFEKNLSDFGGYENIDLAKLKFLVIHGKELPFGSDLEEGNAQLIIDKTHLSLLSEKETGVENPFKEEKSSAGSFFSDMRVMRAS